MAKHSKKALRPPEQELEGRRMVQTQCLEFRQHGQKMYVGKIKLKDLFALNWKVDKWEPSMLGSPQQGYQREPEPGRARKFGKFVNNNQISPPSIFLSIRSGDAEKYAKMSTAGNGNGFVDLEISTRCPVYVVDGQHRMFGLAETDHGGKLADFELPFVLFYNMPKFEEARQFLIINKTHKIVRTDLAERFLAEAVKREGQVAIAADPNFQRMNAEWIVQALEIVDTLNLGDDPHNVWRGKIRLPNEVPAERMTVTQKSFTDSLKPLIDPAIYAPLSGILTSNVIAILKEYWYAISQVCPQPFSESNMPSRYAIQATIGTMALHRLLAILYKNLQSRMRKEDFKDLLNVEAIRDAANWDRELPIPHSDLKGGRWIRYGTNHKSFRLIADELFHQIARTPVYKKISERPLAVK